MPQIKLPAALLALIALLGGCEAGLRGAPEPSLSPGRDLLKTAVDQALSDAAIARAISTPKPAGDPNGLATRNGVIHARLAELDRLYLEYEAALSLESRRSDLIASLAALAAGIGGVIPTAATASRVASGFSAAIAGVNEAFDEQVLVDRTIQALSAQMRAGRDRVRAQILPKMAESVDVYPLLAALSDLELYRHAGTLHAAILGLSETAALVERDARAELSATARNLGIGVVELGLGGAALQASPDLDAQLRALSALIDDPAQVSDERVLALMAAPPAASADFAILHAAAPALARSHAGSARRVLRSALLRLDAQAQVDAWMAAIAR